MSTSALLTIESARWPELWPEIDNLGLQGFAEVNAGLVAERPYRLDCGLLQRLDDQGILRTVIARRGSCLIGYIMWLVSKDIESAGLLVASQAAWYTLPGQGYGGVAGKLWDKSIEELKRLGVQMLLPHVRRQGRGKSLGRWLEARGAKPLAELYCLWIGEAERTVR